ncbi:hypothetical protein S83_054195 [Arachis hypogaea]
MFFAVASSSLCILWRWFDRSNLIHGDSSTVELNNSNMLLRHIIKYGHGCWSSVPKQAGLQRCGKSCRLRLGWGLAGLSESIDNKASFQGPQP